MHIWLSFLLAVAVSQPLNLTLQAMALCQFASWNIPGWSCAGAPLACSSNWTGILCTSGGVTKIQLPSLGLTGSIPTEIAWLAALRLFDVDNNVLSGVLPTEIGLLSQLTSFQVPKNQLSGTIPPELFNATRLAYLQLDQNAFSGTIPTEIGKLTLATYADLSTNRLTLIPTQIGLMANMRDLDFSVNLLTSIPTELGQLTQLTSLDLADNFLSTLPSQVGTLSSLRAIDVHNNRLNGSLPIELYSLWTLTFLDVHDNYISAIPTQIGQLGNLITLNIDNNAITTSLPSELGSINSLRQIHANENQMTGTIPSNLGNLGGMNNMDLSNNRFSGSIPTTLGSMVTLQSLWLDENQLSGTIPSQLAQLVLLNTLTLHENLLSGQFPPAFSAVSTLSRLSANSNPGLYFSCWPFPYNIANCQMNLLPGYNCSCTADFQPTCAFTLTPGCFSPTTSPTRAPTGAPSQVPTAAPTAPTDAPTPPTLVPTVATVIPTPPVNAYCGNGILEPGEQCDDGNDIGGDGCTNCTVDYGYLCTPVSPSVCTFCFGQWVPVSVGISPLCSACDNGTLLLARVVSTYCASTYSAYVAYPCSFPCIQSTSQQNVTEIIPYLSNNSYLQGLLQSFNISEQVIAYQIDSETFAVAFTPCTSSLNLTYVNSIVSLMIRGAFQLDKYPESIIGANCTIIFRYPHNDAALSYLYFLPAVLVILILALIAFLAYWYYSSPLHQLPKEISWSFFDKLTHPWRWQQQCNDYHYREYSPGSAEWMRVENLLVDHFGCSSVGPAKIMAIYNPTLTVSFINLWNVYLTRMKDSPELFYTRTYTKNQQKLWVIEQLDMMCATFSWNKTLAVPLIPALHGTDFYVAEKIAQTGFAALASMDAGFYGRGIYFTSSLLYTLPYACGKKNPAVILSYLNLGNVYPVTEHHKGDKTLLGTPLKSGYNSHYALTKKDGTIFDQSQDTGQDLFNELIVGQESQILPAFIVTLDQKKSKQIMEEADDDRTPNALVNSTASLSISMDDVSLSSPKKYNGYLVV